MFGNMLTPQNIIGFIKSNTDFNKLALNFINSQEANPFTIPPLVGTATNTQSYNPSIPTA